MNTKIENLFEKINNDYEPMSKGGLTRLGDHLEYGEWDEESYKETLRRLLNIYFNKNSSIGHKRELYRVLYMLILHSKFDFSFEDFKPFITILEEGTDFNMMSTSLDMLALPSDPKFFPIVQRFINHHDKNVRESANEASDRIKMVMD